METNKIRLRSEEGAVIPRQPQAFVNKINMHDPADWMLLWTTIVLPTVPHNFGVTDVWCD